MSEIYEHPVILKAEDVNTYRPMLLDLHIRLDNCTTMFKQAGYSDNDVYNKMERYRTFTREMKSIMEWASSYTLLKRDSLNFEEINHLHSMMAQHLLFIENRVVMKQSLNMYHKEYGTLIFEQEKTLRSRYQQIMYDLIEPAMKEHRNKYGNFNALL